MRIAIVDSSPLINLTHLGLAVKLAQTQFFDRIYVPRAVHKEVNKKRRFRYRLNRLYQTGFFAKCVVVSQTHVDLLLPDVDRGEAEAIIQGQEKQATFFIGDDRRAREIAVAMGLKPVGTLRILARLSLQAQAPELKTLARKLERDLGFRASDEVVRQATEMAAKPI